MSSPSIHSLTTHADRIQVRRLWMLMALGLAAGLVAFSLTYWAQTRSTRSLLRAPEGELAWLRHEFGLSEAQFARVSALHNAYRPTCGELCRRIGEQNRKLQEAVLSTNRVTPEIERLVAETGRVRDECRAAMLKHLYEVASAMPPDAGRRYLDLMLQATCVVENPRTVDAVHTGGQSHVHGGG
jgi:hypothetical protein